MRASAWTTSRCKASFARAGNMNGWCRTSLGGDRMDAKQVGDLLDDMRKRGEEVSGLVVGYA